MFMHGLPTYVHGLQEDYLSLSWGIYLLSGMLALGDGHGGGVFSEAS